MAQKPLFKKGQKAKSKPAAANRHGKVVKVRKGEPGPTFSVAPTLSLLRLLIQACSCR
jgi:hypothetical protein